MTNLSVIFYTSRVFIAPLRATHRNTATEVIYKKTRTFHEINRARKNFDMLVVLTRAVPDFGSGSGQSGTFSRSGRNPAPAKIPPELDSSAGLVKSTFPRH